jgi:hypothetical protein
MKRRRRLHVPAAALLAFLSCPVPPAFPWGDKGHEIVGGIAERHLGPKARKRIDALLPPDSSLAVAATWPDRIAREIPDMNPFHYVNLPKTADTYVRERDCPERNCVVEALAWYRAVLGREDAPNNIRRIALRFVAHLVGDVHQPLHAGHAEDRGGNDIIVTFQGMETNLHRLWDTGLLEAAGASSVRMAKRLNGRIRPADLVAWRAGSAARWAEESAALARSHAYKVPPSGEVTKEYAKAAVPVIERRLSQAGVRLAWILNGLFN